MYNLKINKIKIYKIHSITFEDLPYPKPNEVFLVCHIVEMFDPTKVFSLAFSIAKIYNFSKDMPHNIV